MSVNLLVPNFAYLEKILLVQGLDFTSFNIILESSQTFRNLPP